MQKEREGVEDLLILKFPAESACNFGKFILEKGQKCWKFSRKSKKSGLLCGSAQRV